MAMAFFVRRTEFDDFWDGLLKMKEEMGQSFIIYMADEKPEID